jgi:hypothetical protein
MTDEEIDTSDIPPLEKTFFAEAEVVDLPQDLASARRRTARSHARRNSALPGCTKSQ